MKVFDDNNLQLLARKYFRKEFFFFRFCCFLFICLFVLLEMIIMLIIEWKWSAIRIVEAR